MSTEFRRPARLSPSLLGLAAVLAVLIVAAAHAPQEEVPKMPATATRPAPPIDLHVPKVFSTATFGLG